MEHKNDLDFNAKLYGKQRFGFRKISVGLVAVALGTTFFLNNGQLVHADTENSNEMATSSVVEKSSQTAQDTKSSDNQSTLNNAGNNSEKEKAQTSQETNEHSTIASENTTQHSDIANDNSNDITKSETTASEQRQNDQSNSDKTTEQISSSQSVSLKDLDKETIPADQLRVEKQSESSSVKLNSITVKQGEDHILNSGDSVQGKSSISITANISGSHIPASNSTIDLKVGNAGDSETDDWQVVGYTIGSPVTSDDNAAQVTYNGNGDFSIKPLSGEQDIANFGTKFTFSLKAKNVTAETSTEIPVTVNYNNVSTFKTANIKIMPYKAAIHNNELAHIWTNTLTNANTETNAQQDVPQYLQDKQNILQYMLDWNWNKLTPLNNADFTQTFSEGQKLLPDTIKVFRVYKNAIDKSNQTGDPDTKDIYNFDPATGTFLNEDTAFEEFLQKHLYVTESGTNTPVSYDDFVRKERKAVQDAQAHHQAGRDDLAKQDMDSIPTINEIHFHVNGPFEYTDSNGIKHDWSKNGGTDGENDNDTTKHDPHASFFIQMDTLLPTDMPTSWVIPGDGPSSTITTKTPHATVSSDGDNGTTIYTGFNNGLNGWSNPEEETAKLYFADVTDHKNVVDLDNATLKDGSIVPNSLNGSNESGATIDTQIKFDTVQDVITQLENNGYTFVGVSNGEKTSGNYDGSSRYLGGNYNNYLNDVGYGNYSFDTKKFTLNFIKTTKPYSTSKTVHEQTTYVYENGPENNYVEDGNSTTQFNQDSEQNITIKGTGTQYQDGSNQTVNTWTIDGNGTFTITVPTTGHDINPAYAPDYSRIIVQKIVPGDTPVSLTVTDPDVTYVNDNNGNITITVKNDQNSLGEIVNNTKYSVIIPYYSKKVTVHYIDEDTIDPRTGKNKEFRAEDDYVGQPGDTTTNNSNTNITNYIFDKSASNGGTATHLLTGFNTTTDNFEKDGWTKPIQFDNSKLSSGKVDLTYETDHYLYFYHATHTNYEYRSVKEHVSYYYENGPKQGQSVPSQFTPKDYELNFVRSQEIDSVTGKPVAGDKGNWSNWSLDTSKTNSNNDASFKVIPFSDLYQQLDDNYKLDPDGTFKVSDNTGKGETEQLLIIKGANGSIKAIPFSNDEITALANGSSINIQVPYKVVKPVTPPQPSQPTQQPTQQPSQPTQQPTQPTKPVQPTQQPSQPTTVHHKSTPKKHTKKPNKWNTNNTPHGEHNKRGHKYSYNNNPKGERTGSHGYNTNITPKGERTDSNTNNTPKGTSTVMTSKGQKTIKISHKQSILPQTGERKSNLGLIGICLAALAGWIGLAVDRKKREN